MAGETEYRFRIDAYSPDKIPMTRLAVYMGELAALLGESASVHFRRLERGSTVIVHAVEKEAVPKVSERTAAVRRGDGTQEAMRAFNAINKLLREDNAVGDLRAKKQTATILVFPGRLDATEKFMAIRQHGSIDGVVNSIGGKDETVHIRLDYQGRQLSGCYTTRSIAKELAHRLFEPVRLFGRGRWNRDDDGNWTLEDFKVESFEPLSDAPLSDALTALRAIPSELNDASYSEIEELRHGPGKKGNGVH
ncbi:MAG TPA: hypothetical protein VG843_07775 [Rhizomicrobium sp.]|jgi:hypothetical protein|nr:hypothetical protein [Rhizomicrobium sp.]